MRDALPGKIKIYGAAWSGGDTIVYQDKDVHQFILIAFLMGLTTGVGLGLIIAIIVRIVQCK